MSVYNDSGCNFTNYVSFFTPSQVWNDSCQEASCVYDNDTTTTEEPWSWTSETTEMGECDSHADCYYANSSYPFCYNGQCDSCDECHYCSDGIDGTCGYFCNSSYPLYENSNCTTTTSSPYTTAAMNQTCNGMYNGFVWIPSDVCMPWYMHGYPVVSYMYSCSSGNFEMYFS